MFEEMADALRGQTEGCLASLEEIRVHAGHPLELVADDKSNDQVTQKLFKVLLKGNDPISVVDTSTQGASWDGEILPLTRLLQSVAIKNQDGSYLDLPNEEILWGYFTLQDAIDFARYAVETTINTMRFKNVVETVGGNVDILVITPEETKWLQKTELK